MPTAAFPPALVTHSSLPGSLVSRQHVQAVVFELYDVRRARSCGGGKSSAVESQADGEPLVSMLRGIPGIATHLVSSWGYVNDVRYELA